MALPLRLDDIRCVGAEENRVIGPAIRWLRLHAGVRARSALAAALIVAAALTLCTTAFLVLYRQSIAQRVDDSTTQRAQAVATEVSAAHGRVFRVLPHRAGEPISVQVLNPAGEVVASSAGLRDRTPLATVRPKAGHTARENLDGDADDLHLVAIGVKTLNGTYVVLAGHTLRAEEDSFRDAVGLLVAVNTLLLAIVAVATWWFVGRSLLPVEQIRAKVASITGTELDARVPVPAARDEVARLAETMNEMLDRLQAAVSAQRRFVADASHELRSPLATARAALDLLATGPLPGEAGASVTLAQQETERLGAVVEDLLLLARADEHGLSPRATDVDLDDLVDAERHRLAGQDAPKVTARIAPAQVHGDPGQLARALRNLVDNAVRHAESQVELTVGMTDGHAVIEVADDGPGIPAADRERIFDRFVRLDESRHRGAGGTGLGLAIVREIVSAHGGTVTITTAPTGGALFRITLPYACLAGPSALADP
jgi:signal transduction histidine kinase